MGGGGGGWRRRGGGGVLRVCEKLVNLRLKFVDIYIQNLLTSFLFLKAAAQTSA